jgi:bacillithiol biosynthesis cysteine-adding enzyme BshC
MADEQTYGSQLYQDYLFDFNKVSDFYEYDPAEDESFKTRHRYLRDHYTGDREMLANILKKYNQSIDCGQETLKNIELLSKKGTGTIITGQQAGTFTGPLYTIHKAVTTILLAREARNITGDEVVPLFWVASEDHDFNEINYMNFINTDNELESIRLSGDYIATSVGDIPVDEEVFKLIEQLNTKTYDTDFKEKIINDLSKWAKEADDLAEWFSRIMLNLFKNYGLIIFDPMWTEFRELSTDIYQEIIYKQPKLKESFKQTNQRLKELDYSQQITKDRTNTNLFVYIERERNSLLTIDNEFKTRNEKLLTDQRGIIEMIKKHPESFSPNVVLRPLVQEYLLPTLAYVGGPGEIAYHGQLKDLYSIFNLQMPILYPRESITIVESRLASYMEKYDLQKEDILNSRLDQSLEEELALRDDLDIPERFNEIKEKFSNEYQGLIEDISEIDQNLEKLGEENLERIIGQVDYLEEKTEQFHKRNSKTLVRQFKKLKTNLLPKGKLQERVLNIFPYLLKYDYNLINDLVNYFELSFEHRLYYRGDEDDS